MRTKQKWLVVVCLVGLILVGLPYMNILAQAPDPQSVLIPMGGGYSDLYPGYMELVVQQETSSVIKIIVLPAAYATNPESITEIERKDNLEAAERRRYEIEQACLRSVPEGKTCEVILVPIFVRTDALNPEYISTLEGPISAVFILGGDQTIAMQVLMGTPIEEGLAAAYQNGTIVGGTSAGGGMLSKAMLGGYAVNYSANNALEFGSADLWNSPDRRGLSFGTELAIFDQHFFQRSRVSRLLNSITQANAPEVGVGIDAYTGLRVANGSVLDHVFGLYDVAIFDAKTYHAAAGVRYIGEKNLLSFRNMLVHFLAPGDYQYDMITRQHSLAGFANQLERNFDPIRLPDGAGPLILAGDLSQNLNDNPVYTQFRNYIPSDKEVILVVTGYDSARPAQAAGKKIIDELGLPAQVLIVPPDLDTPVEISADCGGIIVVGKDQSKITPMQLENVKKAWLMGIPVLMDNAPAALAGKYYAAHPPTPEDAELEELAVQKSFINGQTTILPGLGLLDGLIEPRMVDDNRWGRLVSLLYQHPDFIGLGIMQGTAVEITEKDVRVLGENQVFLFDFRSATFDLGDNQGFVVANGMLDVFASSEKIVAENADVDKMVERQPTPSVTIEQMPMTSTSAASLSQTETSQPPVLSTAEAAPTERAAPVTQNKIPTIVIICGVMIVGILMFLGYKMINRSQSH